MAGGVPQRRTMEFVVRMDDGSYRFLPRQGVSDFASGDRVKLSEGQIEHSTQ